MTVCLMYHDVIGASEQYNSSGFNIKGADDYKLTEERFQNQVALTVESHSKNVEEIIFSFDDGGKSAIKTIAPVVEKYKIKGVFFIPTSFIGQDGFLSGEDIKELHRQGHIIGSHSHLHPIKMNKMPRNDIFVEWQKSISILSALTSSRIDHASVPGGWYSREVAEVCSQLGIKYLYTSEPTCRTWLVDHCRVLGRFVIRKQTNLEMFNNILTGKGLIRELMWWKWAIGRILKKVL